MPIDILMPQLSPTMSEGRLAGWKVKEGDVVASGDILAEVETDKATMEVEASDDGVIHKIIGQAGKDIQVGEVIAILKEEGEEVAKDYEPTSAVAQVETEEKWEVDDEKTTTTSKSKVASQTVVREARLAPDVPEVKATKGDVKISPVARKLAEANGIDISRLIGTGPKGRIVKEDVEQSMVGSGAAIHRGQNTKEVHAPMRKAIAKRLTESKQETPHFYLNASVNMNALLDARQQLNARANGQYKLTVNDFIIKACAVALRDNPDSNVSWYDDAMIRYGNVDISVAVATDGGLITPILENADQKSLVKLSNEMKDLASKARAGTLKPEEYQGGNFSLSNLGMYSVKNFSAIINPPQAAILAVGGAEERVIVKDGQMQVASVMDICLSVDHRAIDGAVGALLLKSIKENLENPIVLVA
ncbi:MAG: pyruvate dehydrogenase complex dihydrolipoamide acetyltransferase [Magnetococcales bacterium]|nr:pyruvate dehydrogenase complex dihydrolipoamide acetyltransferase [Magnetococcales bacterium]